MTRWPLYAFPHVPVCSTRKPAFWHISTMRPVSPIIRARCSAVTGTRVGRLYWTCLLYATMNAVTMESSSSLDILGASLLTAICSPATDTVTPERNSLSSTSLGRSPPNFSLRLSSSHVKNSTLHAGASLHATGPDISPPLWLRPPRFRGRGSAWRHRRCGSRCGRRGCRRCSRRTS